MSKKTLTVTKIIVIDPALVKKVYTGKRNHCCCGCSGTYNDSPRAIAAHITRTNTLLAKGEGEVWGVEPTFISADCGKRMRTIYITDNATIKVVDGIAIITRA